VFMMFRGSGSICAEPFTFDLFVVCTTAYHIVLSFFLCAGFPVSRLLLLRDRESMSSCNLVWLDLVFLWCTGGEGCPSDLTIKSGGPITFDLRSGVSSLAQVRFWAFYSFFRWIGGREVVEAE
jgi:hypothetical protein